jgi:hypothetical protein
VSLCLIARYLRVPATPQELSRRMVERRKRHELEFLPAALEIIETPTCAAGRIMMGLSER